MVHEFSNRMRYLSFLVQIGWGMLGANICPCPSRIPLSPDSDCLPDSTMSDIGILHNVPLKFKPPYHPDGLVTVPMTHCKVRYSPQMTIDDTKHVSSLALCRTWWWHESVNSSFHEDVVLLLGTHSGRSKGRGMRRVGLLAGVSPVGRAQSILVLTHSQLIPAVPC